MRRVIVVTACLAVGLAASACAGPVRYPGRADAREGDRRLIRIEETNSDLTAPYELRIRAGTDVTWLNATRELVFVRFYQPVQHACETPVRFTRTYDGASFVSNQLAPFNEARLCFADVGRYNFVVSSNGGGGGRAMDGDLNGSPSPVRYGVVIVE